MQYKNKFGTIDVLRKSKKFNNKTLINHISTKKKITYTSFLDRSFEFLNFLKLKKILPSL